jgi:hypothetical protein
VGHAGAAGEIQRDISFPGAGPRQHRPDEPAATAQEELTAVWVEVAA